ATSIIRNVLTEGADKTEKLFPSASLSSEWLAAFTDYSRVHYGIFIALIAAIIMWFIMDNTTIGYEIKAVGYNPQAAKYAVLNVCKNIILAMVIPRAVAGLAGSMEGLGTFERMSIQGGFSNLGYEGIAVALLSAYTAIGVVLSAILFGGLKEGALNM